MVTKTFLIFVNQSLKLKTQSKPRPSQQIKNQILFKFAFQKKFCFHSTSFSLHFLSFPTNLISRKTLINFKTSRSLNQPKKIIELTFKHRFWKKDGKVNENWGKFSKASPWISVKPRELKFTCERRSTNKIVQERE